MDRLRSFFILNPIVVKELRARMRGGRAFITLTVTLLLMTGILYGLLQIMIIASSYSYDVVSPRIGQTLFTALAFLELFMVCAITPAVTAGAISGEREKRTYELLQATPLSPSSIILGKLISALSYIFLLLFAAVPLASLVFIFGGVVPRDMLKALLVLIVLAISFGMLGLFMSALFGRTGRATVASFVVVVFLLFAPLFALVAVAVLQGGKEPPRWLLVPSPISILSSVLLPATGPQSSLSGILPFLGGWWAVDAAMVPVSSTSIPRPLYHYSIPLYAGLTLVLYLLTTRLIQPARRWRLRRKDILIAVGSLLGLGGLIAAAFLSTASRYEWVQAPQAPTMVPVEAFGPIAGTPMVTVVDVTLEPGSQPGPTLPLPPGMEVSAAAEIYAAIARQLITQEEPGGQAAKFPVLFLVTHLIDDPGAAVNSQELPEIPAELQQAIAERLSDLSARIEWVPDALAVPRQEGTGAVQEGGAILSFGPIQPQSDGSVQVVGNILISGLAGSGNVYILSPVDGAWQITGTTGPGWVK